jgi:putative flippase GtrA
MTHSPFAVLIPAYQPGPEFPQLLAELIRLGATRIVVVDDGSGSAFQARFEDAQQHPEVKVVRHAINLGKGAALKTGINAILCDSPETPAVVTADADGQHHPEDIMAIRRFALEHRGALILGTRTFSKKAPLRSRLGNGATRAVMRIVAGQKLADTQTGLRAIPASLLPLLLKLPSQGYEFELDMLLLCHSQRMPILEAPIRTIYLDGNSSSHFNPLLDSMRIYFVLLRFGIISMGTAVLDNLIFSAMFLGTGSVLTSQIAGRAVAMLFNFTCVKRMVFNSRGRVLREFLQYTTLVAVSGTLSFGLIAFFVAYLSISVLKAKLLAEGILFLGNFLVQRDLIFTGNHDAKELPAEPDAGGLPRSAAAPEADVRQ